MHSDVAALPAIEFERLLNSLVVPRPIAWVSTVASDGGRNLAPFSYFNVASSSPPILMISFSGRKHSLANIRATKEFVVHVVSADMADRMVQSSADYPEHLDEIAELGLATLPGIQVNVPRLKDARAALERRLHDVLTVGSGTLVFGAVLHLHVDDRIMTEGRVDLNRLRPVGRLGGNGYSVANEDLSIAKPAAVIGLRPQVT